MSFEQGFYLHETVAANLQIGDRRAFYIYVLYIKAIARCSFWLTHLDQWSGRFLGMTGCDPSVCKSNRWHVDMLRFSFTKLRYILWNSSKMIGNFPAVLNFNQLFLKLNRFICN